MTTAQIADSTATTVTNAAAELRAAEARLFRACSVEVGERYLQCVRPKTRVRVLETGSGAPTLHVHGGGAFAAISVPLVAALPGRRHIMLDRPGFGLSDYVELTAKNVRQHSVDLLASTLDALGIDTVDLVGNSLGGAMSIWFALAQPSRVRSLSLVGAAAFIGEVRAPLPFRLLGTAGIGRLLLSLEPPSPKQVATLWKRFGHDPQRVTAELLDVTLRIEQMPDYARAWREILSATVGPKGPRPGLEISDSDMRSLACPVAIAWGDADTTVPHTVGQRVAGLMANARFSAIPGAGHMPWATDARRTAAAIVPVMK